MRGVILSLVMAIAFSGPAFAGVRNENLREACDIVQGLAELVVGGGRSRVCARIQAADKAAACRRALLDSGHTRSSAFLQCSRKYRTNVVGR